MNGIDWTLLRSLAAIHTHGSLTAAAKATGMSQPTLSRHISQLEQIFGARLVVRSVKGVELTERGAALIPHVLEMEAAAGRVALVQAGQDQALEGPVRITASQIVSTFILPKILTSIRRAEPGIEIELVSSDESENLLRREADIAIRMYRPTQDDMITRKVADLGLGVYASAKYLEKAPPLTDLMDIVNHDVVGYDRSDLIIRGMAGMGLTVTRDFFAFRSDDQVVCWQMVQAGFGIGFMQTLIGRSDPGLVEIADLGEFIALPVWLTAHGELRSSPRIRRVFDALAEGLTDYAAAA